MANARNRCIRVSDDKWDRWKELAWANKTSIGGLIELAMSRLNITELSPTLKAAFVGEDAESMPVKKHPKVVSHATGIVVDPNVSTGYGGCDHAGTEFGKASDMSACPKCGAWVSKKDVKP